MPNKYSQQSSMKPRNRLYSIRLLIVATALAMFGCCGALVCPQRIMYLGIYRTFDHAIEFAVSTSKCSSNLHFVVHDGKSGFGGGPVIQDNHVSLSSAQITKIRSLVEKVGRSKNYARPGGLDGSTWRLMTGDGIGVSQIDCWSPNSHADERDTVAMWVLGQYVWALAGFEAAHERLY